MSGTFLRLSLVVGAVMVRVADCRTNLPATSHPSLTQPMTYSTTIPYISGPTQYSSSKSPYSWPLESSCSWQTMCPPSPWRMKQWPGDRIGPSSFSLQDIAYTPPHSHPICPLHYILPNYIYFTKVFSCMSLLTILPYIRKVQLNLPGHLLVLLSTPSLISVQLQCSPEILFLKLHSLCESPKYFWIPNGFWATLVYYCSGKLFDIAKS